MSFQFQWHKQCSPLLVEKAKDLGSIQVFAGDPSTEAVQIAQKQWIGLYSSHGTNSNVAKMFMLLFLSEVYKELLSKCHIALRPVSPVSQSASSDPIDVYYRFGGAMLASMLRNCYKAMNSIIISQKDRVSKEIHILYALKAQDKSKVPEYLKY